ncbi:MAG: DUF2442 domain-containing protein [Nitrospirae bacterium]|nr:DUF2442 domain-containing protein [Nitrospirota bacterium]
MLIVNEAKYAGSYRLRLAFYSGMTGTADLKKTILNEKRPIFLPLKEEDAFRSFKVEHNTVVWVDELDLAAEYLFYLAFKKDSDLQEQFRR